MPGTGIVMDSQGVCQDDTQSLSQVPNGIVNQFQSNSNNVSSQKSNEKSSELEASTVQNISGYTNTFFVFIIHLYH